MPRSALQLCSALVMVGGLVLPAAAGAASYLQSAEAALKRGDLPTAEIQLRNAVRDDPQNANIRFDLAAVEMQLGDPVSAERDVRAAAERGFDRHKTLPLLGASLLAQERAKDLLNQLKPTGKDPILDAETDVLRGQAQLQMGDREAAKASYADAERADPSYLQAWIADARLAMSAGDKAAAKDKIAHALSVQPKSIDALVLKSVIMTQSGDAAGALKLLDNLIAEQPPALPARVQRAGILLIQGKRDQAKKDVDAVLAMTPKNVQALYLKAEILHGENKNREAASLLDRLEPTFNLFPRGYLLTAVVAQANGEPEVAEENAAKYIARVPQDVAGYQALGQLYLQNKRPDLAIQPLQQAIQAGKTSPAIYLMLGQAAMAVRQPELANQAFAKLRELEPANIPVVIESARALEASGHADQALQLVQEAFNKNPGAAQLQDALVSTALATGDITRTEAALAAVKKAAPDTPSTQNLTGVVQIAALDTAGAVRTLEPLVKAHPDLAVARLNLARAYAMLGRGEDAQAQLREVLKTNPTAEPALTILVGNEERAKKTADAIALLEDAHRSAPKNDAITAQLGAAYLRSGAPQKALDLAREAEEADGGPTGATLDLMANAQVALKHFDDASETFSRLLRLEPRAIQARQQYVAMLVKTGDYEAARNVLGQGMAATPRAYQLELDYALVDLKASGLAKALQTAESLQQQDMTFGPIAALRGDVYMAANKPEDAINAYKQALASKPSSLLVSRLAAAYTKLAQPEKARAALADWMAKNPSDYGRLADLSQVDIVLKRYGDAKSELTTLVGQQPHNGALLNNLAWVDQQLGDNQQALPLAQKAYVLTPSPQTADTLGWILTEQGKPAQGVELLRQAVASGDPAIAYHLAVALKDVGQKQEAVRLLTAVSKYNGNFAEKADAEKLLGQMTNGS